MIVYIWFLTTNLLLKIMALLGAILIPWLITAIVWIVLIKYFTQNKDNE